MARSNSLCRSFPIAFVDRASCPGHWVETYGRTVKKGPYVDGKRHGDYVRRDSSGRTRTETYVNGLRAVAVMTKVTGLLALCCACWLNNNV